MARPPKPERKTELLDQIVEYLIDKTFASLSFRTVADGLGISSYVLVYHFGNREELVSEIVRHIESRHDSLKLDPKDFTPADFRAWVLESWRWLLEDRNRNLQRLEFEAAVQDAASPTPRGSAMKKFGYWHAFTRDWLVLQGLSPERAEPAARVFTSSLYGLQYDYVVNQDRQSVERALHLLIDLFLGAIGNAGNRAEREKSAEGCRR